MLGKTVFEITHPIVAHKLDLLRDIRLRPWHFRNILHELSLLLLYEALGDLPTENDDVKIWTGDTYTRKKLSSSILAFVPIIRAGIGMIDAALNLVPKAPVCFIGMYRDERNALPHFYYKNIISDIDLRTAVIIDPMLATGGSILQAMDLLKKSGCQSFKIVSVISAPEGIRAVCDAHPDVPIYTGRIDEKLNDDFFIVPGLGDVGDRCFNTV